ncbi:MAG: LPXTG cell wall anchor domain-containing protein, partial [Brevibacterium aurantiacum]
AEPEPPVEPVADTPAAPAPPAQLPRTGTTGNGMLIGAGIFLIGLGATALIITGSRRNGE